MNIHIFSFFLCALLVTAGACLGKTAPVNHKPEPEIARAKDDAAPKESFFEEKETCEGTIDTRSVTRIASNDRTKIGVDLVWTGSELGAAWIESRGSKNEITLARIGICP